MAFNTSFQSIAEQIITFNNNVINILSNINSLASTNSSNINFSLLDAQGVPTTFSLPSFNYLQTEINRLNNNINSLYGTNNNSALIQNTTGTFTKIVTVDLNLEPADVPSLNVPTTFVSKANFFIDTMLDPELFISIDLSSIITGSSNIREILAQRYIIKFEVGATGSYTPNGISAINSFNATFKGKSNINMNDFLIWNQTTPGVLNPSNPKYDQRIFDFNPNQLQYYGIFSVLNIEEDSLNNLLWYYLDTLTYTNILTNQPQTLAIGDNLIINVNNSSTIYQITNVSNSTSNPKVTFIRTDGMDPVPVGIGTLKFYSAVLVNTTVNVNIGHNEYNILFIKALNTDNFILSKNWSPGVGYYTSDLNLISSDVYNGQTMQQYYTNVVADYGMVLADLSAKYIPATLGAIPTAPLLVDSNFNVVQTNTHLTNTPNANILKNQAAQVNSLNTQLQQLTNAISSKNTTLKITKFSTVADQQQAQNDIINLQNQYTQTAALKTSINTQILNTSTSNNIGAVIPEFAIRGFWTIPAPIIAPNTTPQQTVQFEIQYQKASADGTVTPIQTFQLNDISVNPNAPNTAAFSNWISIFSNSLPNMRDPITGGYTFSTNDQNNPDVVNINQLDIPIQPNETIQFRIRALSQVGWPDAPLMSPWSNTLNITFPNNLTSLTNQTSTIVNNAQQEDIKTSLLTTLNNQGLSNLLSQQTTINNTTYYLSDTNVISSFKDSNGNALSINDVFNMLMGQITTLQAQITNAQGQLQVIVFNANNPNVVANGSVLNFTINCEDYATPAIGSGIPTGRVWTNKIYLVSDFSVQISNTSTTNTLGLLTNILYTAGVNTTIYNSTVPQIFWVDNQNNLIVDNSSGISLTQESNQFVWSVNYDSVNNTTVTKLSDDIGNSFRTNNNNSITNILSETEYNIGYANSSVLSFIGNNNSLMDDSKWIDIISSVASQNKLLTTIHPQIIQLSDIVDANTLMIHSLQGGINNAINIPINIYFKMNALDTSLNGANYQYINLNGVSTNVQHIKELKFSMATATQVFSFRVIFTINRVNSVQKKTLTTSPSTLVAR